MFSSKMVSIKLLTTLVLVVALNSYNIDLQGEKLTLNKLTEKKTRGTELNYFELEIPSTWKNEDLIIDSSLKIKKDLISSPLVIISLEPITSHMEKNDKQWICNQLGSETCFLPANYLTAGQKVYLGVLCKDCEYNIKYSFTTETKLKLGQSLLFHLKKGDRIVFDLTLTSPQEFKDYINISTFNLRMSKYNMKVNIVNSEDSSSIEAPVSSNWIGGQQSLIHPKNFMMNTGSNKNNLMNYSYKIMIVAEESGVFSVEATSGNTTVALADSNLRFDNASNETPMCYFYNNTNEKTVVDIRSINGDVLVYAQADKLPEFDDYYRKFTVNSERDEKIILDSSEKVTKWFLCIQSSKQSYYSIHIYNHDLGDKVQYYKKLLYSK